MGRRGTAGAQAAGLVAVALIRFAHAGYMGGTLLAIVTLGVLLHPAVAGALARVRQRQPADDYAVRVGGTGEALHGPAVGRQLQDECHDARQGGDRAAGGALATILTQGIPPEGAALPRERP